MVDCSPPTNNMLGGLIIFASTLFATLNRNPDSLISRLMQQAPRVPQLRPFSSFNFGDVLVDKDGKNFFFIAQNEENKLLCDLFCVEGGIIHRGVHLNNLSVVKPARPRMQQVCIDDSTKSLCKLIQEHNGQCLVLSQERKELLVIDLKSLRASVDDLSTSTPSSPKADPEEFYLSPNSVAWSDELYSIETLQKLFKPQPASEELIQVRLNFIKLALIPYLKDKRNFLSQESVQLLFSSARELFASLPRIVSIETEVDDSFTVVGDIHGQYPDLLKIFSLRGHPSVKNKYLFNGDIVDRGEQSCACLFVLLAYKIALPDSFFINRGNHESNHCEMENFYTEMIMYDKRGRLYQEALKMFHYMPTAHILNKIAFIVHGGIAEGLDIAEFNATSRLAPLGVDMIEAEMLWNDPGEELGFTPNLDRGSISKKFGPNVTKEFLKRNKMQVLIRSHTFVPSGSLVQQGGRTLTVFSAPNYCGVCKNEAAVLKIIMGKEKEGMRTKFCYFRHDSDPAFEPDYDSDDDMELGDLTEPEVEMLSID